MANILLTEVCIRSCPYCFAKQFMADVEDKSAISKENLIYIADFLEKSGRKDVSLLGGEPLLHPKAGEIIKYLIGRGFNVLVFTSGIMENKGFDLFVDTIYSLTEEDRNKLSFAVNVNEPRFSSKKELERVYNFLTSFGEYSSLSFNIYRLDYQIDFLIDYILKYGLKRHVRFGLANPIPGSKNKYIHPDDFKSVKSALMDSLEKMYNLNIFPGFDCGFPLCMFSDEDLGKLYRYTRNAISFECGPAIDIGPDLTCWSCFPLSRYNTKSLKEFATYDELYSYFENVQQKYRKEVKGIYVECDSCKSYENEMCSGGCLAHIINKFQMEGNFRHIE